MEIDWAALGRVFGTSVVLAVALVGLFTAGIVGASRRTSSEGGAAAGPVARVGAYAAFAVCAAAVAYGIYVVVA
ncbi:hypothetical protein ACFV3R_28620 [Streptomyces sp. NPDC059740]|uniref:hypothetical protein n=1 Tax=Streptomyces sp. NPDC059740 TaxID=3346926 RepID=UPI0036568C2A